MSQALSGLILWNERLLGRELKEWEKEHIERLLNESLANNPVEEPEQAVYSTGVTTHKFGTMTLLEMEEHFVKCHELLKERTVLVQLVGRARQIGRNNAIKNLIEERERAMMNAQVQPRRCDCLKCRMGKYNQCTTFSPRKRGRK